MDERQLWNYLDHCGIDFRLKKSELIARYETRNCGWTENLDYCLIDSKHPLIDGLVHPGFFQFNPMRAQDIQPESLKGYVRQSDNAYENYEFAYKQISKLFGEGTDSSSTNTKGRIWKFGKAQISITIFPPEMNTANDRHKAIPGSQTECRLNIKTAYSPPPKAREFKILSELFPINFKNDGIIKYDQPWFSIGRTTRRVEAGQFELVPGSIQLDKSGSYLIRVYDHEYLDVLPCHWIEEVRYDSIKPAKGSGGIYLRVTYMTPEQKNFVPDKRVEGYAHYLSGKSSLLILSTSYVEERYFDFATELSKKLNVPLRRFDDYDC